MIKIIYKVTVKSGKEKEFERLAAATLIPQAKIIKDCKLFSLFRNPANEREFIFYELWENNEAVKKYYKNLIKVLGRNKSGEIFPEKLNEFIEEEEDILHQEV